VKSCHSLLLIVCTLLLLLLRWPPPLLLPLLLLPQVLLMSVEVAMEYLMGLTTSPHVEQLQVNPNGP